MWRLILGQSQQQIGSNNYMNALSLHNKSHFSPDRLAIAHRFSFQAAHE